MGRFSQQDLGKLVNLVLDPQKLEPGILATETLRLPYAAVLSYKIILESKHQQSKVRRIPVNKPTTRRVDPVYIGQALGANHLTIIGRLDTLYDDTPFGITTVSLPNSGRPFI